MDYQNELNEKQLEAVSSSDKYLRIIAGAGSGKTRVLTYRIAYLIEKLEVEPYRILAITFTNKVAKEMLERTNKLLPDYDLTGLRISTFHSFCALFLRKEIDYLDITRNFVIYDEIDQKQLIKNIASSFGYKKSDDIVDEAMRFIAYYKMNNILPSEIELSKLREDKRKLYNFYVEYEKLKAEAKALDFDDLLIYTIRILEAFPEVKERYNHRYKHILIDEFQDTNDTQYKLVNLLAGSETSLFVVGDPDQTIYTWRGANQKIILNFEKDYNPTTTIILNENYRSTNAILTAANKLISNNKERVPKDLFTNNKIGDKITYKSFDNAIREGEFIAKTIKEMKLKDKNISYKDFAVLYRSSYLSLKVENALNLYQIPYKVYGGTKFYSRAEIKDCLAYFRLFINEDDDISFERIINVPRRGIGEASISNLKVESSSNNLSMIKYLKEIHHHETSLKAKVINTLQELICLIDEYRSKLQVNLEAYSELLDEFITKIGYKDFLESKDETKDKVENVKALIDDVRNYLKNHPESNFTEYLQNITLVTSQDEIEEEDEVSLMTIHTSKGLEFNYVFVLGLNEGIFPNFRAVNERSNEGLEEERRLAYVSFTRAKKKLFVTNNRDYNYQMGRNNFPSRFIKEADLEPDKYVFTTQGGSERLYRFDINDTYNQKNIKTQQNTIDLSKSNGIEWQKGDNLMHKVFGKGKVLEVDGDFIVVDFVDYGKKTMLAHHPMLSKLMEDNQNELHRSES